MKNIPLLDIYYPKNPNLKLLYRTMRISIFLLLFSAFSLMANNGHSQNAKVTIKQNNVPLEFILNEIESQTDYLFIYKEEVNVTSRKSIQVKNKPVSEVLSTLLSGTAISYKMQGNHIILTLKNIIDVQQRQQQQNRITGVVFDRVGEPLIGVSVNVKGTTQGGITDLNGQFSVVADMGDVLQFSYIGYTLQEVLLKNLTPLKVVLEEDVKILDEVIVVGYGTQKKVNLTGAVASVDSKMLKDRPVQNATQALMGISPGLNITQNEGLLNSSPNINVRGMTTIGQGSSGNPLVLIDGIEGNLSILNPDDIESISILKDASSAAIYGSRAAFGVILVTTKRGSVAPTRVSYKSSFRWAAPLGLQNQADSYSWALFMNDADLTGNYFSAEWIDRIVKYQRGELKEENVVGADGRYANPWSGGSHANVDWARELYKKHSFSHEHNASISGGSDKTQFYSSIDYLDMNGLLKYGKDKYDRLGLNLNVTTRIFNFVDVTYNTRYTHINYSKPTAFAGWDYMNLGRQQWPTFAVRDNNGNLYAEGGRAYAHDRTRDGYTEKTKNMLHHLSVKIEPLKNLTFTADVSYQGQDIDTHEHQYKFYSYDINNTLINYNNTSYVKEASASSDYMMYSGYGNYKLSLKEKHSFNVTVGMQAEDYKNKYFEARKDGIILDGYPNLKNTNGLDPNTFEDIAPQLDGYNGEWANAGFFGRLGYNYMEKYLIEVNARYDGTSRFRRNNRWVLSPSVSVGWNVAKEGFWESITEYVNMLKPRISYGQLANQNTDSWYPTYSIMPISTNAGTWLINGQKPTIANTPGLVSSYLTWETVRTLNAGVDIGALQNRLNINFDWFQRNTKDMIGPAPTLPSALGRSVPPMNNTSLRTRGWELMVKWQDQIKDVHYDVTLMLSDDKTVITEHPELIHGIGETHYFTGKNMGDIYGYITKGIAKTDREMKNHLVSLPHGGQNAIGSGWAAGDIMYEDVNGDGKITPGDGTVENPGDMVVIGNSMPRYRIGANINVSWKGLDLGIMLQGVLKRDFSPGPGNSTFYGATGGSIWWSQALKQHVDYFRDDAEHPLGLNLDSYYPRPLFQNGDKNQQHQTRYIQSAAYLRMKNIQLGYTLPVKWTRKIGISTARVFVSGENLLTFTSLSDIYDPETMWSGYYGTAYPLSKTYSFGLNVNF